MDIDGRPAHMPALGGAGEQPLRFLDFLIYEPVRAVFLHGAGVPVLVPAPERYAIHKLIVSTRHRLDNRDSAAKSDKDIRQAATLMTAMIDQRRTADLADAYMEAWDRGPAWREAIRIGLEAFDETMSDTVTAALGSAVKRAGSDPAGYELPS